MKPYYNTPPIRRRTVAAIDVKELQLGDTVHCRHITGEWHIASIGEISIGVSLFLGRLAVWVVRVDEIHWQPSLKRWEYIRTQ